MSLILFALFACDPGSTDPFRPAGVDLDRVDDTPVSLLRLDGAELSTLSQQALALAPTWIQPDLELAFRRVDADVREGLAGLIVDLDEPHLTDELAFSIAHLSPEVLADEEFDPAILVENVQMIYAVDGSLAYADLIESGEPGENADYSTTVRYQMDVAGLTETFDLPAEIYYWYVVHPRIEDEHPLYIAAWETCGERDLECATTADLGDFWRTWLWEDAAETCPEGEFCPTLASSITEATTLWSTDGGGVGAVGEIAGFMLSSDETLGRWLNFGAGSERSIQPNRIYGLGAGNCGEWSDMTTALSRLALIPNQNIAPSSWDHTWNRFYDPSSGTWVNWEPVNWWFDHDYGAPYANHGTRGDGAIFMVTADDTDNWFTMEVVVSDEAGLPVDGATVSVYSPYGSSWWWGGEQLTDSTGTARFELTAEQSFAFRVDSEAGDYPDRTSIVEGSTGIVAGETDSFTVTINGSMDAPVVRTATEADAATNATLSITGSDLEGRIIGDSHVYGDDTYTIEDIAPPVRWFVTTSEGYEGWKEGAETLMFAEGLLGDLASVDLDVSAGRVLVIVNEDALSTAALGSLAVDLTASNGSAESWSGPLVLPPGDSRAFELSGGPRAE